MGSPCRSRTTSSSAACRPDGAACCSAISYPTVTTSAWNGCAPPAPSSSARPRRRNSPCWAAQTAGCRASPAVRGILPLTPGGSSGGASASVAAGVTPLAIGTDMGGSTRLPAAYTGLVGMRPSTGRIARRFGFPATCIDFQVIGPFARTMRDMRLLYGVLAGPDPRDPYSQRFPQAPDRHARPSPSDRLVHRDR